VPTAKIALSRIGVYDTKVPSGRESGQEMTTELDGPAASAYLNFPNNVAVYAGNVYIANSPNQVIRMVDNTRGRRASARFRAVP